VRTVEDVRAVQREVQSRLEPLQRKVFAIINYDHFYLEPEVEDEWAAMVRELLDRYYVNVTRYSTSGFLRAKLGPALAARGVAPHIYESADEARSHLRDP
jgi:propionate CoA-transferase